MSEDFIDYIATLDPQHRVIKQENYGNNYLVKNLKEIEEKDGCITVAEIDGVVVGYGIAVVSKLTTDDLMEVLPHTPGRVTELYVDDKFRGQGIGSKIMNQLEDYLRSKNCQTIHIGVFVPNVKTHELYKRLGYADRNIDMIKLL